MSGSTKKVVAIDLNLNLDTFPSTTRAALNQSKKSMPVVSSSNDNGAKTQRGNLLKL